MTKKLLVKIILDLFQLEFCALKSCDGEGILTKQVNLCIQNSKHNNDKTYIKILNIDNLRNNYNTCFKPKKIIILNNDTISKEL